MREIIVYLAIKRRVEKNIFLSPVSAGFLSIPSFQ